LELALDSGDELQDLERPQAEPNALERGLAECFGPARDERGGFARRHGEEEDHFIALLVSERGLRFVGIGFAQVLEERGVELAEHNKVVMNERADGESADGLRDAREGVKERTWERVTVGLRDRVGALLLLLQLGAVAGVEFRGWCWFAHGGGRVGSAG
jgi:hypothetical protein